MYLMHDAFPTHTLVSLAN